MRGWLELMGAGVVILITLGIAQGLGVKPETVPLWQPAYFFGIFLVVVGGAANARIAIGSLRDYRRRFRRRPPSKAELPKPPSAPTSQSAPKKLPASTSVEDASTSRYQGLTAREWRGRFEQAERRLAEHDAKRASLSNDPTLPVEPLDAEREMLEASVADAWVGYTGASRNAAQAARPAEPPPTDDEILHWQTRTVQRALRPLADQMLRREREADREEGAVSEPRITQRLVALVKEGRALQAKIKSASLETWVADLSFAQPEVDDWLSRSLALVREHRPKFHLELEAAITTDASPHSRWDLRAPAGAIQNAFALDARSEREERVRLVLGVLEKIVVA